MIDVITTVDCSWRAEPRYTTPFEILYESDNGDHGRALLADLSSSGVLLVDASAKPQIGRRVHLYLYLKPPVRFEFEGRVVRHTEAGFALEVSSKIGRLVDDTAALVAVARRAA
jgi:hypothetical protein